MRYFRQRLSHLHILGFANDEAAMGSYLVLVDLSCTTWENSHLYFFFFLLVLHLKTENTSLYFCFTAYFSELLFVLLATIGESTVLVHATENYC